MSRYSEKRSIQVEDENDRSKVKGVLTAGGLSGIKRRYNE